MMDGGTSKPENALHIPNGWSQKSFYDLAKITSGQVDPRKAPYSSMILVAPDHIRTGSGRIDQRLTATQQGAISGKYLVQKGEVIYSKIRPNLQKLALADEECLCSADMYPVAAKEGVSAQFLKYLMLSAPFTDFATSVSVRSGMPKINRQELAHFSAMVPESFEEQEAIAKALSDADALIEGLERLIAKKRLIKQGAMQDLLTAKRRLPGFSAEWEEVSLGTLGKTYGGLSGKSKQDFGHGPGRYVEFLDVLNNEVVPKKQFPKVFIGKSERQNEVQKGDLLFNGSSETPEEVGLCAEMPFQQAELYLNSFCFGFRPLAEAKLVPRFLALLIRSSVGRNRIKHLAQGATRYNISKRRLLDLKLPIPSFDEQISIANVSADMDAEIQALDSRLEKARQVKEGMMQNLLTGRIRLV